MKDIQTDKKENYRGIGMAMSACKIPRTIFAIISIQFQTDKLCTFTDIKKWIYCGCISQQRVQLINQGPSKISSNRKFGW